MPPRVNLRTLLIFISSYLVLGVDSRSHVSIDDYRKKVLNDTNYFRSWHQAPPMRLNHTLNRLAQEWAEKLAHQIHKLEHRDEPTVGECLYWGTGDLYLKAVEAWYSEVELYDFDHPEFSYKTGHFTQLIWLESQELGVGMARGEDGIHWVVANFFPPGNMRGDFPANVLPRRKSSEPSESSIPQLSFVLLIFALSQHFGSSK